MPKKLQIIIIAILITIAAAIGYSMLLSQPDEPKTSTTTTGQTDIAASPDRAAISQTDEIGIYVDYTPEAVAATQGKRVLFFHAPWCPQCRKLDASIQSGAIPSDVTIFKVDYDSNQKLRQQYGVTIQTTVVLLDSEGKEAKKYVAYDEPSLEVVIENLF